MLTKADIEQYFLAEKSESVLFMIMGVLAVIAALVFIFYLATNGWKGAAIPLLVVGLIHLTIGINVHRSSDELRKRNVYAFDLQPQELKMKELPRMQQVNRNFVIVRYTEIGLLLAGLLLFFLFKTQPARAFWMGFGLTLAIEALLSLGADYFAERRAGIYTRGLMEFTNQFSRP